MFFKRLWFHWRYWLLKRSIPSTNKLADISRYYAKVLSLIDDELMGHYTPRLGLKTKINIHHANAGSFIRSLTTVERCTRTRANVPPGFIESQKEISRTSLDDFLVNEEQGLIKLKKFKVLLENMLRSIAEQSTQEEYLPMSDYYDRKLGEFLDDVKVIADTIINIVSDHYVRRSK